MELQTDTVAGEKQAVEVSKNELRSLDNVLDKPVEMNNATLEGGADASLVFENVSNSLGGVDVSVNGEQLGLKEKAGSEAGPDNVLDKVVQVKNVISEGISLEGVDIENELKTPGNGVSVNGKQSGVEEKACSEAGPDNVKLELNVESKDDAVDSSKMEGARMSLVEQVENLNNDASRNRGKIVENEGDACDAQAAPLAEETGQKGHIVVLGIPATDPNEKTRRGQKPATTAVMSMKKKSPKKASGSGTRVLRSRSKEKSEAPEPSVNLENTKGSTGKRGRKKGKENDGKSDDAYSKMRKHLRYLLHRIHYEQNLLDAYSSEGWRGQSVEKLRPEKELQRAKTDINRSKSKIRDLFQRLDTMAAEGKFPETLYDSEGLIDSEDIFCAKCGSKDLSTENDIILCDGSCERGFHQYCLDPPLLTEEIPPGDEGWLCPACDCKHDCVDLLNDSLNDSQGTKLAFEDSWEKVFPEAVAAGASKELDDVSGLPSDDSEDNEYNPDGTDDDPNVEGNESNSDESDSDKSDSSDFSSASEDLGAIGGGEQNLGLPSEDSEDDDYDPDSTKVDEEGVEHESSGSDFTSASEDLGAAVSEDGTSDINEQPLPLEPEQDLGESSPLGGKRCVERLDYKKLYDETYGNVASGSSEDDEDWTDMVATKKRKSSAAKAELVSSLGPSVSADGTSGSVIPRRRGRPKADHQLANGSPAQAPESSRKSSPGGSSSSKKRPPYKRLDEAVTQRLYESFKENQYPDRQVKEKLANELGLTAHRVDKWFGNARWSFHHHPSRVEASMTRVGSHSNTPQTVACDGGESAMASDNAAVPICSTPNTEGDQAMLETSKTENSKEGTQTDLRQKPETPKGVQRKRRKSRS
ncbi:hypothetical protein BVRB_5g118590 [Beta vulgaris subsp. vulgaris]|nr:hypothetical protein BVRB_5g118590 [Beta vulgaris subsp. vulgaris]